MLGLYIGIYHVKYAVADTRSFSSRRLKFGVSWVDTTYRDFKKPVVLPYVILFFWFILNSMKQQNILKQNFQFQFKILNFSGTSCYFGGTLRPPVWPLLTNHDMNTWCDGIIMAKPVSERAPP